MFDTAQQAVDVVLIVIVVFIFIRSLVGREKAVFSAALINKLLPSCHTCHTAATRHSRGAESADAILYHWHILHNNGLFIARGAHHSMNHRLGGNIVILWQVLIDESS